MDQADSLLPVYRQQGVQHRLRPLQNKEVQDRTEGGAKMPDSKIHELIRIDEAAVRLKVVANLLYAFHEEYFEETECSALKYDAMYRPEMMEAKISAIIELVRLARVSIDSDADSFSIRGDMPAEDSL